jgi:hypothetical protein
MTLGEATLLVDGMFIIHEEVGQEITSYDQNDKSMPPTGARDMTKAPCGGRYITVTSGGTEDVYGVMFHDEGRAIRWWVYSVEDYAESIAPREKWDKLHLYWREGPKFIREEYIAMDQAGILQRQSRMNLTLSLGTVRSRMLITKLRPNGTEEPDV